MLGDVFLLVMPANSTSITTSADKTDCFCGAIEIQGFFFVFGQSVVAFSFFREAEKAIDLRLPSI